MGVNIALKRLLGVFPNLYQADFYCVLWVTRDITSGDFCVVLGNGVPKR
jgi:hypothetical protein